MTTTRQKGEGGHRLPVEIRYNVAGSKTACTAIYTAGCTTRSPAHHDIAGRRQRPKSWSNTAGYTKWLITPAGFRTALFCARRGLLHRVCVWLPKADFASRSSARCAASNVPRANGRQRGKSALYVWWSKILHPFYLV